MTEADFQAQVVQLAALYGWSVLHVRRSIGRRGGGAAWQTTTSIKGWPDLFCFHPVRGSVFAAELKSATGKPTQEQTQVLEDLAACGIPAYLWRPDDLDAAVAVIAGTHATHHGQRPSTQGRTQP